MLTIHKKEIWSSGGLNEWGEWLLEEIHNRSMREFSMEFEVEHETFTPLVMSTSGGWGPLVTVAFRRSAGLIAA